MQRQREGLNPGEGAEETVPLPGDRSECLEGVRGRREVPQGGERVGVGGEINTHAQGVLKGSAWELLAWKIVP